MGRRPDLRGEVHLISGCLEAVGLSSTPPSDPAAQVLWIGSIPVLGALFRSQDFQNNESELVVIVTPHLVKPARPGQNLRIPQDNTVPANDVDQFIAGDLEIKKRPLENGIKINGKTTSQYGHILQPRPPLVKVPVATAPAPRGVAVGAAPVTLQNPVVPKQ